MDGRQMRRTRERGREGKLIHAGPFNIWIVSGTAAEVMFQ